VGNVDGNEKRGKGKKKTNGRVLFIDLKVMTTDRRQTNEQTKQQCASAHITAMETNTKTSRNT
jgi:hypothetical protein